MPTVLCCGTGETEGGQGTVRSCNLSNNTKEADDLTPKLTKVKQLAMEQAREKGASSWLTAIPMLRYGYNLSKQAFRALCLRFDCTPTWLPQHCFCGHPFSVDHPLSCPKGTMPSIWHKSIWDITPNSSPTFAQTWASSLTSNPEW